MSARLSPALCSKRHASLRRLRRPDERFAGKIEHHVEALSPLAIGALEVDRTDSTASFHALAVRLALVHVDLVGEVDRLLRAGVDAGVAARADLQIDRVVLLPGNLERAEMAFHRLY